MSQSIRSPFVITFLWFQLKLDFKIYKLPKNYDIIFEQSLIKTWTPRIISSIPNLYLYVLFVWLCRNNYLVAAVKTNDQWVWQTQIVTQVLGTYYIIIIKDTKIAYSVRMILFLLVWIWNFRNNEIMYKMLCM